MNKTQSIQVINLGIFFINLSNNGLIMYIKDNEENPQTSDISREVYLPILNFIEE